MFETVYTRVNRVTSINNFEVAHYGNPSGMRGINRHFDQREWQTKVNFDC
jgi:hypothetical protein